MANFLTIQQKAKSIKPSQVRKSLFDFIRSIEQELVAYNQATLFQESESVTGKPIGFYSKSTEIISGGKKKAGEPFTLYDTGDFLDSIYAKIQGTSILFDATDPKKKEVLKNLLTDDILGLQDDDLNRVIDERFLPLLLNYYKKMLL